MPHPDDFFSSRFKSSQEHPSDICPDAYEAMDNAHAAVTECIEVVAKLLSHRGYKPTAYQFAGLADALVDLIHEDFKPFRTELEENQFEASAYPANYERLCVAAAKICDPKAPDTFFNPLMVNPRGFKPMSLAQIAELKAAKDEAVASRPPSKNHVEFLEDLGKPE